ncbi:MAG: hypothetical protein ABL949_04550 [Fimbriimonadaceae bacterium]
MLNRILVTTGLLTLTAASFASGTALCIMPIADILGHREVSYTYGFAGNEKNISGGAYSHGHSFVVGALDRVEFGFANDFQGNTTYGAKLLIKDDAFCALSVGLWNYDNHKSDPYLVARKDFDKFRLHGGVIRDDRYRLMFGADYDLGSDWSLMADWMSGPNNAFNFGINIPVKQLPGLVITPIVSFPSVKSDGIAHSVSFAYGIRF